MIDGKSISSNPRYRGAALKAISRFGKSRSSYCPWSLVSLLILWEMQAADYIILAGPDGSFGPVVARNAEVLGSNPGRVGCSSSSLCMIVLQTVQRPGVCSAVCGTVHYKMPLKSFDKGRV